MNNKISWRWNFVSLLIIVTSILAACTPIESANNGTDSVKDTELILTNTPEHSTTNTAMSATITPLPTEMPTQARTLTNEQTYAYFQSLYKGITDCDLPCWWGLSPGISTEEQLINTLTKLDSPQIIEYNGFREYKYNFEFPEIEGSLIEQNFFPRIWVENDHISYILISGHWVKENFDFSLSTILNELGTPSEIRVEPTVYDWEDPYYLLEMVYLEQGVIVRFSDSFEVSNKNLNICLDSWSETSPAFLLFAKDNSLTFNEIAEDTLLDNPDYFYHLEDIAFGYNPSNFYNQFSISGPTGCISLNEEYFVDNNLIND